VKWAACLPRIGLVLAPASAGCVFTGDPEEDVYGFFFWLAIFFIVFPGIIPGIFPGFGGREPGARNSDSVALTDTSRIAAPESPLEERFLALIREYGLAEPTLQHWVRVGYFDKPTHYRVDFAYPDIHLAVETDGIEFHAGREAYDERRDHRLLEAGWRTERFTWPDVFRQPIVVIERLRELGVPRHDGSASPFEADPGPTFDAQASDEWRESAESSPPQEDGITAAPERAWEILDGSTPRRHAAVPADLLADLVALRSVLAAEWGQPPEAIFSDEAAARIAAFRPQTQRDMYYSFCISESAWRFPAPGERAGHDQPARHDRASDWLGVAYIETHVAILTRLLMFLRDWEAAHPYAPPAATYLRPAWASDTP
jgi:very-short-patch-repair endonuclease